MGNKKLEVNKNRFVFFFRANFYFLMPLILSFLLYICTLSPTSYWDDSGELITAAVTLGIPHPPGFPLFLLLGKLFSFIPFFSVAWRLNLMSAVFSSLSVMLLCLITYKITKNKFASFATGMILAVSAVFWHYATVAEVYSLNIFLFLIEVYLLLIWKEKKKNRLLYIASLIFGLSITTHPTSILLLPAFIYFIFTFRDKVDKKNKKEARESILKIFSFCVFFTFMGLLVLLFLPLRSSTNPVLDWGNVETINGLYNHLTAKLYQNFFIFDFRILHNLLNFFTKTIYQYGFYIFLCGLGIYVSIKEKSFVMNKVCDENKKIFYFLLIIFFAHLLFNIFYNIPDIESYYLIMWVILSLFIGIGVSFVSALVNKKQLKLLLFIFLILGLFIQSILIYDHLNKKNDYSAREYAYFIFDSVPQNAVLLSNQGEYAPLFYYHFVENVRTDLLITPMVCVKDEYCIQQLKKNNVVVLTDNFKEPISLDDLLKFKDEMAPRPVYVMDIFNAPSHYDNSSWKIAPLDDFITNQK